MKDPMIQLFTITAATMFIGVGLICAGEWLATTINSRGSVPQIEQVS